MRLRSTAWQGGPRAQAGAGGQGGEQKEHGRWRARSGSEFPACNAPPRPWTSPNEGLRGEQGFQFGAGKPSPVTALGWETTGRF